MPFYRDAAGARNAGVTYHLVPEPVWDAQRSGPEYLPEAFPEDGFIHCTNGLDQLLTVANTFHAGDPRPFVILALEMSKIFPDVRYDDPDELFPHIHGPSNTGAVIAQTTIERSADGLFRSIPV